VVAASSALSRTSALVRGPDADGKAIWSHACLDHFLSMAALKPFSAKSPSLLGSSCLAAPSPKAKQRSLNPTEAHAGYPGGMHATDHQRRWSVPSH
jgi:hypothetical protein